MFSRPIIELMESDDVASFTADITNDNSADKAFLDSLNQGAVIPLLLIYPPGSNEPYVLRGVYSQQDVFDLVEQARAARDRTANR